MKLVRIAAALSVASLLALPVIAQADTAARSTAVSSLSLNQSSSLRTASAGNKSNKAVPAGMLLLGLAGAAAVAAVVVVATDSDDNDEGDEGSPVSP